MYFKKLLLFASALCLWACAGPRTPETLSDLIPLFTADNVPETGPAEDTNVGENFAWMSDKVTDPAWPGEGLSRYPMLYIGEGYNRILLVDKGEVVWKYDTGPGWELGDIWMLRDGSILFSRQTFAAKVTPDKREVWRYDCQDGEELHTLQPIGKDLAFMLVNKKPTGRVVMFNHNTGEVLWEHTLDFPNSSTHGQSRRMRYTDEGTWLLSYISEAKVVEFDKDWNIIWQYDCRQPWSAVRLRNGNTLISLERDRKVIEVNKAKETVWELDLDEIPEPYRPGKCQTVVRLNNGNTILCARGTSGSGAQLVEVTPDKQVVWAVEDWKHLGPVTAVQILSEPGWSENPGDFGR
ncbi:MAG: PQQ-binding-like beta-propeller repeat protein [Bacteroidales bacterium]|nr:PQQ-binding-like beta-propeller repeat protein [Bacteroidales bacterium]